MGRNSVMSAGFVLAVTLAATPALGWGEQGHMVINRSAADLLEGPGAGFFQANVDALATLATTPDVKWKAKATYAQEAPMHFFQWDNYGPSSLGSTLDQAVYSQLVSRLGASFVKTNGASVWRIDQIYVLLVDALRARDWTKALQMAGTMGHYVGDLSQPMHDTSDYDGQSIGRRGIHAYFETTLVKQMDQGALEDSVTNAGGPLRQQLDQTYAAASFGGDRLVRKVAVDEGVDAFSDLPALLAKFDAADPSGDDVAGLKAFFPPRMGRGAATLAWLWDRAVRDAGVTDLPGDKLDVAEPAWFPLQDPATLR